jgi:hypothetical protein
MTDDGVIYYDGMRMFKHILFHCDNGKRTVQGFLISSIPESNMQRQDIMFVADNDPLLHTVNEGWQLDSSGNWLPPEISLTAVKTNLESDIAEIRHQLHLLKEYEETAEWLGVTPYSEECNAVLPLPVYHKPEIPQAPKYNNLFEAFQSLVQDEVKDIVNVGIQPMLAGVQQKTAVISTPTPIPPKSELISLLQDKRQQLSVEELHLNGEQID